MAASVFGVLLSTISDSQQVAFLLSSLLTLLPVFILSGFVFPFRNMPWLIQGVSYVLPGRYYLAALRGDHGEGRRASGPSRDQVLALVIFAVATCGLSVLRLQEAGR